MNPEPPPPEDAPEEIQHVAFGRELVECRRCSYPNALDPARPAERQHCTSCGCRLAKRRKRRRWFRWGKGTRAADPSAPAKERLWVPFAGAVLVAVIATIFLFWMLIKPEPAETRTEVTAVPVDTQVRALIAKFGAARRAEEILGTLRNPDRHTTAVMAWCANPANKLPLDGELIELARPRPALGHEIAVATARLGQRPLMQVLCVNTPAGWRIDWRAFSQGGDMSAEAFLAKKPAVPTLVFLVAQQSTYYNGPYADQAAWLNLRLTDTSGSTTFYAAVPRSDAGLIKALDDLPPPVDREGVNLARYAKRKALRLKFTHPELSPPQAEVTAVEGDGWFIP